MKRKIQLHRLRKNGSDGGFTLLEVVISLIVVGIMGSMLVTMTQSTLSKSVALLGITRNTYSLATVMENINAHYASLINPNIQGSSILNDIQSNFSNYGPAGYTYTITSRRFADFVDDGTGNDILVPGSQDDDGAMMRVTITDATGMSLSSLFYDNNL